MIMYCATWHYAPLNPGLYTDCVFEAAKILISNLKILAQQTIWKGLLGQDPCQTLAEFGKILIEKA